MRGVVLAVLVAALAGPACAGRDPGRSEKPRRSEAQKEIEEAREQVHEGLREANEEVEEGLEKARRGWRDIFR